jgi:hypothetical protein
MGLSIVGTLPQWRYGGSTSRGTDTEDVRVSTEVGLEKLG